MRIYRFSASVLALTLLLVAVRSDGAPANINPMADLPIKNGDATTISQGCGVVLTGGTSPYQVSHPAAADAVIHGIVLGGDIAAGATGSAYLRTYAVVQVKVASAVSFGDALHIADALGRWETAPSGAQNVYFEALQGGTAGTLVWAMSVSSRPK